MTQVSLAGDAVSLAGAGVSLVSGLSILAASGESLNGVTVSIVISGLLPNVSAPIFNFSLSTSSMYLPIFLGGFA